MKNQSASICNDIQKTELTLIFNPPLLDFQEAINLRGAIAKLAGDQTIFHHHEGNTTVYKYPQIQYKVINGKGIVVGINEGAIALAGLNLFQKKIRMKSVEHTIIEQQSSFNLCHFGINNDSCEYEIIHPWLALNEKNYSKYIMRGSVEKRLEMLRTILIGNILSMSKGLNYKVNNQIKIPKLQINEIPCRLKNTDMIGFLGRFYVNFSIPPLLGIGKSVARGFGTLKATGSKCYHYQET